MRVVVEFSETQGFRTEVDIDEGDFRKWSDGQTWPYPADEPYRLRRYLELNVVPYHRTGLRQHLDTAREVDSVAILPGRTATWAMPEGFGRPQT